jgi:hypothetical protein
MSRTSIFRTATVLGAGALVLTLAGSLALRAAGRSDAADERRVSVAPKGPVAPVTGTVPQPRVLTLADVPQPLCWSCPGNRYLKADFQLDLDLLAPLGDGPSNVALWLRRFSRSDGDRFEENHRAGAVEVEIAGKMRKALPDGHPFLAEAEPWVDQASCSFYPEVWALDGPDTPIPNMLVVLDLARSFVARGLESQDAATAREDFRRAIRLGRLLRQDDATIIQDLIGLECIRIGAWAMNEKARERGDVLLVAATNSVLADHDSLRARTYQRVRAASRIYSGVRTGIFGGLSLDLSDNDVAEANRVAMRSAERRFQLEALVALRAVYQLGDNSHRELIEDGLKELAASDDVHLSRLATLALEEPYSEAELEMLEAMGQSE